MPFKYGSWNSVGILVLNAAVRVKKRKKERKENVIFLSTSGQPQLVP